ncbi:hypothetical protein HMPREF1016_02090 [Bacteroides eggerthii 1_2_48FAA]|uniref:Uncharacterized protein n=1 Tax=Bacteroides eggerthii 1_2_48FAA TaxID=665953 RepID=E5WZK0_9BACE|nr:hypothetical protein HMPREF1016_02090 [Bacteroides eggerthii 1_2_48FAA]
MPSSCMVRYSWAHAAASTANATSFRSGTSAEYLFPKNRKQGKNKSKKDKQNRNISIDLKNTGDKVSSFHPHHYHTDS